MNILFLEHDRDSRRMVKDMLRMAGATVIELDSRAEPIASGDKDVALAVVELAGVEQLAAVRLLAGRGSDRPPIIVVATSLALVGPARAAGADEVLTEPVAMTALFQAIGRYLPAEDPD